MTDQELEELRYPTGRFRTKRDMSPEDRDEKRSILRLFPVKIRAACQSLTNEQLDTPYRPGGWTIRQLVHHTADSHMNAYIRFRWALTEEEPEIKVYDEKSWALLPDASSAPISLSLDLLHHLHARWLVLLEAMSEEDYQKILIHPQSGRLSLDQMLELYAWHSNHHLAHIVELMKKNAWD